MADVKLIGNDSGSVNYSATRDVLYIERYIALDNGQVNSIQLLCQTVTNSRAAIYSDSSGEPGALLSNSDIVALVAGWNTVSLASPVSIIKNSYYWLAFVLQAPQTIRTAQVCTGRYKSITWAGFSFPNPAGTGYTNQANRSTMITGYGAIATGCPRQAMHMRRLM